ncbi:hypothetical protein PGT21_008996 [Puccinia graminis f. sp. tritici]|uniref:chitin deacetylase n=1 Tax=Puccinia graminis f. sp. tritici TaxID=56615 RepID=A0A5B0RC84_PUCGR|nr:hypothetical protein PGT21_008996 [Puccinia graminis f. sp. tritici]KAA1123287.1 hypothetical protein PGTUg99_020616 [Puccinia graminis f. sp. tritici]
MTIWSLGWITLELIGPGRGWESSRGGRRGMSAGAQMSMSLWRRYPGTPQSSSTVGLEWSRLDKKKKNKEGGGGRRGIGVRPRPTDYPAPSTIGPAPKRPWLQRLLYVHRHAAPEIQLALAIPPASLQADGYVLYPPAVSADASGACSWENSGCLRTPQFGFSSDLDILDPDLSSWVVNFDDGPLPPSENLYKIMDDFNIKATHFWIGGNVLKYWELAVVADRRGDHLAVHTWSHSHLTTMTNEQILGELGWTIQIISDLTGKVPRFFRPPYGNIDNRVRAIAKYVFGLETVIWNYDSVDWGLNQTYATGDQVDVPDPSSAPSLDQVVESVERFAIQTQAGLILQHELSREAVEAFRRSWATVSQQNFRAFGPLPVCLDAGESEWYQ